MKLIILFGLLLCLTGSDASCSSEEDKLKNCHINSLINNKCLSQSQANAYLKKSQYDLRVECEKCPCCLSSSTECVELMYEDASLKNCPGYKSYYKYFTSFDKYTTTAQTTTTTKKPTTTTTTTTTTKKPTTTTTTTTTTKKPTTTTTTTTKTTTTTTEKTTATSEKTTTAEPTTVKPVSTEGTKPSSTAKPVSPEGTKPSSTAKPVSPEGTKPSSTIKPVSPGGGEKPKANESSQCPACAGGNCHQIPSFWPDIVSGGDFRLESDFSKQPIDKDSLEKLKKEWLSKWFSYFVQKWNEYVKKTGTSIMPLIEYPVKGSICCHVQIKPTVPGGTGSTAGNGEGGGKPGPIEVTNPSGGSDCSSVPGDGNKPNGETGPSNQPGGEPGSQSCS